MMKNLIHLAGFLTLTALSGVAGATEIEYEVPGPDEEQMVLVLECEGKNRTVTVTVGQGFSAKRVDKQLFESDNCKLANIKVKKFTS